MTVTMPDNCTDSSSHNSVLSRRQRVWIALYSLDGSHRNRAEILRENSISEADMLEFEESWLQMRCRASGNRS